MVLHELAQTRVHLARTAEGDWSGVVNNRWQIHSSSNAVFGELEEGRSVLIHTARTHAANTRGKSLDRYVVLAGDGRGKYRLWQIVQIA